MRYALISDVHANLRALEAALRWLDRRSVDAWVCAGDLVGYGPEPDACVARIDALGATVVAGNHDLIVAGRLETERPSSAARRSLDWTAKTITPATRARLVALPLRADAPGGLVVTHGSLDDPERYVRTAEDARGVLARLAELAPGAPAVVLGHTHRALVVSEHSGVVTTDSVGTIRLPDGERWLVNPGSVGQSRERRPLARAAVLDVGRGTVQLARLSYDVRACRAALERAGQPAGACHAPPRPVRAVAARVLRRGRPPRST